MPKKTRSSKTKETLVICAIRLPPSWLKRLDKLAASTATDIHSPVSRSTAMRIALGRGLDDFEGQTLGEKQNAVIDGAGDES